MIVDLMCETKDYQLPKSLASRLLLSLIPKDSRLIVIDVDESIAYNRKHDIPSINYLKERRKLYLTLAKNIKHTCNRRRKGSKVHKDILSFLHVEEVSSE